MKLADDIELIDGTLANCYVVKSIDKTILIDAGMKSSAKKIIGYFESKGSRPDIVLITHCHPDHIGGLADIESKYGPDIFIPDEELDIARGSERMPSTGGVMSALAGLSRPRPISTSKPLSNLGTGYVQRIDSRGHTPGSTSYYFDGLKALFVGDAVSENKGKYEFNKSFTLDPVNAQLAINRILEMHGVTAYPGHGKKFLIP